MALAWVLYQPQKPPSVSQRYLAGYLPSRAKPSCTLAASFLLLCSLFQGRQLQVVCLQPRTFQPRNPRRRGGEEYSDPPILLHHRRGCSSWNRALAVAWRLGLVNPFWRARPVLMIPIVAFLFGPLVLFLCVFVYPVLFQINPVLTPFHPPARLELQVLLTTPNPRSYNSAISSGHSKPRACYTDREMHADPPPPPVFLVKLLGAVRELPLLRAGHVSDGRGYRL